MKYKDIKVGEKYTIYKGIETVVAKHDGTKTVLTVDEFGDPSGWGGEELLNFEPVAKNRPELSYTERIVWFLENYYESGLSQSRLIDAFIHEDLSNLRWNGDIISIPKYKDEL